MAPVSDEAAIKGKTKDWDKGLPLSTKDRSGVAGLKIGGAPGETLTNSDPQPVTHQINVGARESMAPSGASPVTSAPAHIDRFGCVW